MKSTAKKIKFSQPESMRLDNFLAENFKTSRSQAQKMIEDNNISINTKPINKSGAFLKNGDIVVIEKKPIEKLTVEEKKITKKINYKINIVSATKDYLVVEKPSGLLSHPTEKNETDALSTILLKKYPELKKIGEDPKRPGIVHRLDKDASGLMVVARTQKMFVHLKDQFKNRTIEKEYMVLVHSKVAKDWDEINFPLERSRTSERMAAIPLLNRGQITDSGKTALTEFWVEQRFVNFTLLRVKIHTGRMHQIRAHMLAYNHPVVGDPLYIQKKRKDKWDKICGRLFLHCIHLSFIDLKNKRQTFTSALPEQLKKFLTLLT